MSAPVSIEERRKQVLLGPLSQDFLRVTPTTSQMQISPQHAQAMPMQMAATGHFIPPNTRGRLSVTIMQARLTKNYGIVRMDPYCRVRIGTTIFETPTDTNGAKNPRWNRTIYCYLPNGVDSIYLEIFDERAFTQDERVAWGNIQVPDAVLNGGETIDDWYCLSGSQGEGKEGMVNLVLSITPVDAPPVNYVPLISPQYYAQVAGAQAAFDESEATGTYTDADVAELLEMFPQLDGELVREVLDDRRGDKQAAINGLLEITSVSDAPAATEGAQAVAT